MLTNVAAPMSTPDRHRRCVRICHAAGTVRALRACADRRSARGQHAHGAVLLGARPSPRGHVSAARRGHRPLTGDRRDITQLPKSCSGSALTGTRAPRSAVRTRPTARASGSTIYAERRRASSTDGAAYQCYCTPGRTRRAPRGAAQPPAVRPVTTGAAGPHAEQVAAFEAEGRRTCCGSGCRTARRPGTTWSAVRSPSITIRAGLRDHPLRRHPLYLLAAAVDDVRWGSPTSCAARISSATPRQLALYRALGIAGRGPAFAHLPLIVGADGKPLSKRHGEVSLAWYRRVSCLRRSPTTSRCSAGRRARTANSSRGRAVGRVRRRRVNSNPARFDIKKLEAINGDWIRSLPVEDLAARVAPVLERAGCRRRRPGGPRCSKGAAR